MRMTITLLILLTLFSLKSFAQDIPYTSLEGHTDVIESVAFNPDRNAPDRNTLASASWDGTMRLWNVKTGVNTLILTGHEESVYSVAFHPDGNTLASGSKDDTVRLWNVETGKNTLSGPQEWVRSVAFSPDGDTIAGGSSDNTVRLWNVETGKHIRPLTGHTALVTSVAFSPDGNTIASGSSDKTVRLWDVNTGTNTHTLTGHAALVTSVAFSPDGKTLASGSSDKTVRLWNVETETYTHMFKHTGRVTSVAFSPDRKTLASGGYDKTVRLWDVHTHTNIHTLAGHTGGVKSVAFSPDGHTLASGSSDGTVRLWELPPTHVTLTPNPVVLPPIGKQFTISANIVGGENVAGYQVSLRFDTTALRYVESAKADYLPSSFFAPPVVSWNKITLAATSLAGLGNGDGTLATVTFEVLALKASVVEVFDVILSNGKGEHLFSSPYGTKVTTGGSPKPDLVVKVVNDTLHEIDINKKEENDLRFNLKVRVRNQGTGPSHETRLRYYQSANDKVSSSDTEIPDRSNESYVVPPLNPGETSEISREFIRVPESVGDHYYKVYVDRVPNESNTDNNWSDLVKVLVYGDKGLKLPQNLISNVAFGRDSTYFVVNAEFPQSYIPLNDFIYGNCVVTFDILGVPTDPVSVDDPKNSWRFDNPGYFMYPLQTPRARLAEIKAESDVDTHITMTTSAIGVVTGVGIGATLGSVIPVLGTGLGALAGRAIGGVTGYFVGVGLRAALEEGGDVIDEEIVLASTADPTLIFWPRAEGSEPPSGTVRTLLLIEQEIRNIKITVEQVFQAKAKDVDSVITVKYEGIWNLEETFQRENPTLAAPQATPMSLSDYPPFQELPPEIQEYLLQHFREFTNTEVQEIPEATALLPNYPNPFNPETWIPYRLAEAAEVQITIYDIKGAIVRQLTLGHQHAGNYTDRTRAAYWNGRNENGEGVASGIYFYQLRAGDYTATKRMLILK